MHSESFRRLATYAHTQKALLVNLLLITNLQRRDGCFIWILYLAERESYVVPDAYKQTEHSDNLRY